MKNKILCGLIVRSKSQWSSGYDSILSRWKPEFDSRLGREFKMGITDKQAKAIIEVCSHPKLKEDTKIRLIKFITNNDMEILLTKMQERLKD